MLYVDITNTKIDVEKLYYNFYKTLSDTTGTILIHHGKAKYPGKYVKNYSYIELYLKDENALQKLTEFSQKIYKRYNLNKLFVIHQLGRISKNDTILFLAAEAKDRNSAFKAVSAILEEIKDESLIGLKELE